MTQEHRWVPEAVLGVTAPSYRPYAGTEDQRIKTAVAGDRQKIEIPTEVGGDGQVRRTPLRREYFEAFGFSANCVGCVALQRGNKTQNHTEACRTRMEEQAMASIAKGR